MAMKVRCHFYVRTPAADDRYEYERVNIAGPSGDTSLHTDTPPVVGDLIFLSDSAKKAGGTYRVIERSWLHSSWGSSNWPYGEPESKVGPMLDIIVEAAEGPFVNEAPTKDEE